MSTVIKKRANGSLRVQLDTGTDTKTIQSAKKETDINYLIARYKKTGQVPPHIRTDGVYGDFTKIADYQTAMNRVIAAQENFMLLPSELRREFDNNPQKLLEFMEKPSNRKRAQELGLVEKPKEPVNDVPEKPAT